MKLYFEMFDIDKLDTIILNEMAKKDFCLNDFKKKYGKNRIERLVIALKEFKLIKGVKTKPSPKERGRNLKIFRLVLPENFKEQNEINLYLMKKKRHLRILRIDKMNKATF